ncbi:MAG: hypothetical protein ACYDAJ_11440 [Nitrosotalea sp.]
MPVQYVLTVNLYFIFTLAIFGVGLVIANNNVFADNANGVEIQNIQVQPSAIKVGDTIIVTATLVNNSTFPIYLTSGSCIPAFSVVFDAHAKQVYPNITCTTEAILQKVDPQSEVTISNENKPGVIYQAVQPGIATVNITLPYFAKNQTATDYSNIYYNTSKSFSFTILNQSGTSQQHTYGGGGPMVTITLDPLEQFKSGIAAKDVTCTKGLHLLIRAESGDPACVTPETATKLFELGWTKQIRYYVDKQTLPNVPDVEPKITLFDYSYGGIDKDSRTISIDNQTYYQTTFNYTVDNLKKGTTVQFHNVTFTFPEGVLPTPGGSFLYSDMKFPDGSEEIYGGSIQFADRSGVVGGIPIPVQFGLSHSRNSTTVLGNHIMPQAGITIYHDKIKLLVSK